ncbi:winged helix-turn-helix transcriptional regulator [Tunturiibacter psychrotolerans]|uniref:winged helix-turn-helix transcriptional regulator n=1 Tax=Tunturiibacter psychrotolerans TaxID=3069686 RepID=UPI003340F959
MRDGPVRLGQLGRRIPTASKKVLTENLRNLESAGLVVRTDKSRQVRHVEYDLAEASKSATHELLDHLGNGERFMTFPGGGVRWSPKQGYFREPHTVVTILNFLQPLQKQLQWQ